MNQEFGRFSALTLRILTALMAFSLLATACGDDGGSAESETRDSADGDDSTNVDAGDTDATPDEVTIGVSFYDAQVIPLYVQMEEGMADAAAAAGVEVSFSYAAFDPVAQVDQIETMITNGVDLILVTPLDPTVLLVAYESARDAGIPIISFANKVKDEAEDLFIGLDWAEFGQANMRAVAEFLEGKGNVALVTGPPELAVVQQVQAGWDAILTENPGLTVVDTLVDPDMSQPVALNLANTLFAANSEIDAVLCTIDQICLGVAQAASEHGLDQAAIFIAAMDADATAVEQVRNGTGIDQTFSMKGVTWGIQAIDVAMAYLAGDTPAAHTVESEFVRIGPDNVAEITSDDLQ